MAALKTVLDEGPGARLMSALGHKQTSRRHLDYVRFTPESGHGDRRGCGFISAPHSQGSP